MEDKAVKKILSFIIVLLLTTTFVQVADAQVSRHFWLNRFHWAVDTQGATWLSSFTSLGQNTPSIMMDWQPWPSYDNDIGFHGVNVNGESYSLSGHGKPIKGVFCYWVGATNWTAPPKGKWGPDGAEAVYTPGITYPVFLNDNGPQTLNSLINTPETTHRVPVSKYRYDMPMISIDGIDQQPISHNPVAYPYEYVPDLIADGYFETSWNDPIGVTFFEKRYVYSHPDYENMQIFELTITNDGDANSYIEGNEKEGQTLTDFWLGLATGLGDAEFAEFPGDTYYNGRFDWFLEYDPATRYYWAWDGDAADWAGDDQFDPRGGPIGIGNAENPTGEFLTPEVIGYSIISVSKNGGPDDPNQPATFRYKPYQDWKSPVNGDNMTESWNWMTGADGADMYQKGFSDNPYGTHSTAQPHYHPMAGFGPYTLGPGESIKLVYCVAFGSIPESRAIELGTKVKSGEIALADAKKEIYETGRDELFAQFERAADLYLNIGLANAPRRPVPPTNIVIESGPEEVSLKWDPVAGATAYRVYRAVGGVDNGRVYKLITETKNTSYVDKGLLRGTNYFYNVTTVQGDLESNKFYTRTNKEAVPFRSPPSTADWVDKVRVVPNPINVRGNTYVEGQPHNSTGFNFDGGVREQNTLLFVNLPAECTIRVYDSVGLLIKTLEHTSGTADERWSPIISDDNLIPASGVYFYTVEAKTAALAGQVATGKLVIVR